MAHKIIMPKQGLQMTEGVITQWLKQEGETIQEGEPFFEMETDKLSITIDASASGTVLKLLYEEGDMVPVTETIAIIGEPGEDYAALLSGEEAPAAEAAAPAEAAAAPAAAVPANVHKIILPKQGLQMTEGVITQWLKQEGDEVKEGEPLFEMETDKLSIVIDSTATGTVLKLLYEEGDMVPVTETIAYVGPAGTDIEAALAAPAAPAAAAEEAPVPVGDGRIFASPRAKMVAEEKGVDIASLKGTGPDGLIIERDVLSAKPAPKAAPVAKVVEAAPAAEELETVIPLKGMRKIIAERMHQSLHDLAQANHRMEVDMTQCVAMREQLKAAGVKVSYNDMVIRCVAKALTEFPMMNSSMTDTAIIQKHYVNVGMAVATDTGLLVPVIKDTDKMSLTQISEAAKDLGKRTKEGGLNPDELTGGTFTVTNLGMFGVDSFTAVINAPEAGILAVGQMKKRAVVLDDDSIVVRPMMWLSLTYDHRIVDGAPAAQFLKRIKTLLETPALLL
ncbi:MAG: 2-oxo acid dehydrogenase subunit E2 [Clostridia bacterium]|nr:2-oxo acid dehydrogenase subunit E2 [Clostridia bacterium]